MKLINKLFVLLSPVLLMAEDSVCQKKIFGTNVSLINIFWDEYSKGRSDVSIDEYVFSIEENSDFYIVNCKMNIEKKKEKYKKNHPDVDMSHIAIKGGCGWGKISKDDLKIIEKKYFK